LAGYKELEAPHIDVHKFGVAAVEAEVAGDMEAMLHHVEAMEAASIHVVENLDRMSEVAMKEPALLCHE
jgi:hypothetical protein